MHKAVGRGVFHFAIDDTIDEKAYVVDAARRQVVDDVHSDMRLRVVLKRHVLVAPCLQIRGHEAGLDGLQLKANGVAQCVVGAAAQQGRVLVDEVASGDVELHRQAGRLGRRSDEGRIRLVVDGHRSPRRHTQTPVALAIAHPSVCLETKSRERSRHLLVVCAIDDDRRVGFVVATHLGVEHEVGVGCGSKVLRVVHHKTDDVAEVFSACVLDVDIGVDGRVL